MAQKKKVAKKVQRTQRPARASKKSLGIQVLILFILFQLVSLLTVQISGRGTAYLYMMLPLMIITYGGWLCVNRMHADVPFFLDTAMLLTFGTMIQCLLLKQDEMPTSLIVIYVLAAVAGVIAAIVYKHAPVIASAVGTSILMVLSVILYMATLLIESLLPPVALSSDMPHAAAAAPAAAMIAVTEAKTLISGTNRKIMQRNVHRMSRNVPNSP